MAFSALTSQVPLKALSIGALAERVSARRVQPTQQTVLPNGFQVATARGLGHTSTVGLYVNTGSRWEKQNKGISHFTQRLLQGEIDKKGFVASGYANREHTVFQVSSTSEKVKASVAALSQSILAAETVDTDLARTRDLVLGELHDKDRDAQYFLQENLISAAHEMTGLGNMPLLGTDGNVQHFGLSHVKQYVDANYTPDRMLLVGCGNVEHNELVELASQTFGKLSKPHHHAEMQDSHFVGGDVRIWNNSIPWFHCAVAQETPGLTHENSLVMMLLPHLIGSWQAADGKFQGPTHFTKVTTDNAWMRYIKPFYLGFADTGLAGVQFGCLPSVVPGHWFRTYNTHWQNETARLCLFEIVRLGIRMTQEELDYAKVSLLLELMGTSGNSTLSYADELGKHIMLHGRHVGLAEIVERLDGLTLAGVQETIHETFYDQEIVIASMGNCEDAPDYPKLRRATYWNRY